jgi:hypothetical protein
MKPSGRTGGAADSAFIRVARCAVDDDRAGRDGDGRAVVLAIFRSPPRPDRERTRSVQGRSFSENSPLIRTVLPMASAAPP